MENYLDWVKTLERIFDLKYYKDDKGFNLAILKIKGYASLDMNVLRRVGLEKLNLKSNLV